MKRPMFFGAILACICIIISYINIKTTLFCGVGLICLLVGLIVNKTGTKSYAAVIVALAVLLSLINAYKTLDRIDEISGERITESFTVTDVKKGDNYKFITVNCDSGTVIPQNTKLGIYVYNDDNGFYMGKRMTASVTIQTLSNADNKSYYYSNSIFALGDIKNILETYDDSYFYKRAGNIRSFVNKNIISAMPIENAATLLGITIGNNELFTAEFSEAIRVTGVSHIMVVSGMHLTIILGSIFWLLDKIFYHSYIRFLISFVIIVLLTSICGFSLSIVRAGLMFLFLSLAPLVRRDNDSLNSLGSAMIIILLISPFAILGVGFQLSALATFGIIYIVPFAEKHIVINNKILKALVLSIIVTLSATVTTLPVTIYNFGYVSLISPVSNMLISFAVTLALCIAIIGLLLNCFSALSAVSGFVLDISSFVVSYINFCINTCAKVPYAAVEAGDIAFILSLIFSIGTVLFISACKYKENLLKSNYNQTRRDSKW